MPRLRSVPLPNWILPKNQPQFGKTTNVSLTLKTATGLESTKSVPGTLNDHVAAAWVGAVIDVVVGVIVDAAINTGAVSCWQNGDYPLRGGAYRCLLDDNAVWHGAPLVDETT